MRRTIVTVVAAAVAAGAAAGVATAQAEPARATLTAPHVVAAPSVPRWEEDSLPPELYLWLGGLDNGGDLVGPRRADRWARAADRYHRRHVGCWAAVATDDQPGAGTTLIMCPDDFRAYS